MLLVSVFAWTRAKKSVSLAAHPTPKASFSRNGKGEEASEGTGKYQTAPSSPGTLVGCGLLHPLVETVQSTLYRLQPALTAERPLSLPGVPFEES